MRSIRWFILDLVLESKGGLRVRSIRRLGLASRQMQYSTLMTYIAIELILSFHDDKSAIILSSVEPSSNTAGSDPPEGRIRLNNHG